MTEAILPQCLSFSEKLQELKFAACVSSSWCAAVLSPELDMLRQQLARRCCFPVFLDSLLVDSIHKRDLLEFCQRQLKLQKVIAGVFCGLLSRESVSSLEPHAAMNFDLDRIPRITGTFDAVDIPKDAPGTATVEIFLDLPPTKWYKESEYEWCVIDARHKLDRSIHSALRRTSQGIRIPIHEEDGNGNAAAAAAAAAAASFRGSSRRSGARGGRRLPAHHTEEELWTTSYIPDKPQEQWEDGDCFCGIRGNFDFRPVVDPEFLDISAMSILLLPKQSGLGTPLLWGCKLFAPCSWMLPKTGEASLKELDYRANMRAESAAAAFTIGRALEKAMTYDNLDSLAAIMAASKSGEAGSNNGDSIVDGGTSGLCAASSSSLPKQKGRRKQAKGNAEVDHRSHCSGKNPKGLNFFVPRKITRPRVGSKCSSDGATDEAKAAAAAAAAAIRARLQHLSCCAGSKDLSKFLMRHRPSLREADRLTVFSEEPATEASPKVETDDDEEDGAGRQEDASRRLDTSSTKYRRKRLGKKGSKKKAAQEEHEGSSDLEQQDQDQFKDLEQMTGNRGARPTKQGQTRSRRRDTVQEDSNAENENFGERNDVLPKLAEGLPADHSNLGEGSAEVEITKEAEEAVKGKNLDESTCQAIPCSQQRAEVDAADASFRFFPPSRPICPEGLLEDSHRMERAGMLSHDNIIHLAKKWGVLAGKWMLFVPEWRIDELFKALSERLATPNLLPGCHQVAVSPPGSMGTDEDRFMLSAHCRDFTAGKQVMSVGRAFRATARVGLRTRSGNWDEPQDDPFATTGKKVSLIFKPDVFSYLGIHRGNSHNIKPSMYMIDL